MPASEAEGVENMANLSVRNLEEELRQAVSIPEKVTDVFKKYFEKENGVDLGTLNERTSHKPIDFDRTE